MVCLDILFAFHCCAKRKILFFAVIMLKSLVLGREKSKLVLIEDSVEQSARGLLKAFVSSLAGQHDVVHVYLYEMTPSQFTFGLPSSVVDRLQIQDLTVDPFGWTSGTPSLNVMPHLPELPNEQKTALVIDGLTDLVKANSLAAVCRLMHKFTGRSEHKIPGGTFEQVVSVVHKDIIDGAALQTLEYCARCTVNLCGSEDSKTGTACRIVRVSDLGKVNTYDECYSITDTFGLESVSIPKVSLHEKQKPAPDPTSNLTFRLSLKEEEENARRQLVLPYLSARSELQPDLTGGRDDMTCDPDEEDFDEEDPDDDLDI